MFGIRGVRVALALLLPGAGCVVDTVAPEEGPASGQLGATCERADDCEGELVCPAGGHLAGHCAVACDVNGDCTVAAGDEYYCLNGVCTQACRAACGLVANVGACGTGERCVAEGLLDPGGSDCVSWCVP